MQAKPTVTALINAYLTKQIEYGYCAIALHFANTESLELYSISRTNRTPADLSSILLTDEQEENII